MAGASGSAGGSEWWRDAVVYQIYPRSFQDSDGDGIGDLRGAIARLDHLEWLGVDALWLSPIYPSPLADSGYDVADHAAIDPVYGSLADFDELVARAHARGLRVLLDLVASHTSIEHPWFREHPDWYVWADGGRRTTGALPGEGRPGAATRSGRWYLHSFYPEQPDLDWRNPEARAAIGSVIRVWRERGVDGFRVDAVQQLMKDRELRDERPARAPFPLPLHPELAALEGVRSRTDPEITIALDALREAAGDAVLVGEVYVPSAALGPYLERLDLAFAFEFLHAPWEAAAMRRAIAAAARSSASPGCSRTTTSRGSPRGWATGRLAPRPSCCSRCPAPRSSTRATRSECPTGPRATRRSIGPAATAIATRCSGALGRSAASPPPSPGSRRSIPSGVASTSSAAPGLACTCTGG